MQCEFGDLAMSLVGLTKLEAALQGTTPNSGVQRAVTVASALHQLPVEATRRKLCSHILPHLCAVAVVRSLYEPSSRVRPNARTFTILMAGVTRANMGSQGKGLCLALYQEAISQVCLHPIHMTKFLQLSSCPDLTTHPKLMYVCPPPCSR
jgi:hypothetical protein